MKKNDVVFWGVLAIIALFYLLKGNDMHKEVWDYRQGKLTFEYNATTDKVEQTKE